MAVLFADPVFLEHDTGPGHPESAERLVAVHRQLDDTGLRERFARGTISSATLEQLTRVHQAGYIELVRQFAEQGGGRIDPDTVVSPRSFDVAVQAAGAAVAAVDEIFHGSHHRAVGLIRPPGHHALPAKAMGFCLFNNVAVAAERARQAHGISRVLIVDWDVHHGNGTQDVFYDSADVYYFSAHRCPFYPGTGAADERGTGPGEGTTFNLPLQFGISRGEYKVRFLEMLERAAADCRPELVLISAGFDAHAADPIGSLGLESEDFGELTHMVAGVANQYCDGRIVSLLEGGYNVDALAESVVCHLEALLET